MGYNTILVKESIGGLTITLNRLDQQNSINNQLLKEVNEVLDWAEQNPDCRIIILEGQNGIFCTGMDFESASKIDSQEPALNEIQESSENTESSSTLYMTTIKRLTLSPKVIISVVDGRVMAGGIGLVAASDLVIATPRSQFSLSEALWGLLPAMVTPYLIRRIGYQNAYRMTLTTTPVSTQEAHRINLVDEMSDTPGENIRRLWLRLSKLEESTIVNMKQYFRKMWIITEQMEETAISEITRLSTQPKVIENITNFIKYQKFPWENR